MDNLQSLALALKYVNYGATQGIVAAQSDALLRKYKTFQAAHETLSFPNVISQIYLVLRCTASANYMGQMRVFPVKIIIPQQFPFQPPRVYLDQQIPMSLLQQKQYLGHQNAINIPYLQNWATSYNQGKQPNLVELFGYVEGVISSDPPIENSFGGQAMPQYMPQQQVLHPPSNPYQQPSQLQSSYQPVANSQIQPQAQSIPSSSKNPGIPGGTENADNQRLLEKVDQMNNAYSKEAESILNRLIETKVKLYQNQKLLEEKQDKLKSQCANCDNNIEIMKQANDKSQKFLSQNEGNTSMTVENIDSLVYPSDPFSSKYLYYLRFQNYRIDSKREWN